MKRRGICILIAAALLLLFACEGEEPVGEKFTLVGTVTELGDKIAVDIIEAPDGNSGIYLAITSDNTVYLDSKGDKISRGDIALGDKVTVTYSGQVMMSYPAQIVAYEIKLIK